MRAKTQKNFCNEISSISGSHNEKARGIARNDLRVMKFGGTSLADATAVSKVIEILQSEGQSSRLVVVVSAMNGVTNHLIEAARLAEAGHQTNTAEIFKQLRKQHESATHALIQSPFKRDQLIRQMCDLLAHGERLCQGTSLIGELTPRTRDSISSFGERLCAPL